MPTSLAFADNFEEAKEEFKQNIPQKVKSGASINLLVGIYRYMISFPAFLKCLLAHKRVERDLKLLVSFTTLRMPKDLANEFKIRLQEVLTVSKKSKTKCFRLPNYIPFRNSLYNTLINIIQLADELNKKELILQEEGVSVMCNRGILTLLNLTIGIFLLLMLLIIALVVKGIAPISSAIVGCILGVLFIMVVISDFNKVKGQEHVKD